VAVLDTALPAALFRRARRAIARLRGERLKQSYWTTFWMALDAQPLHALEEAVLRLARLALPAGHACTGAEWWLGRSHTTDVPIEFHFDQDVKLRDAGGPLRHPATSTVFFFNRVRGGQLAVTDQVAGKRGEPRPAQAGAMEAVAPRANRYAIFDGRLLHGVLDRDGRIPTRKLSGPQGRLRLTLVVNFWTARPTGVPAWSESRAYRALAPTPAARGTAGTGRRTGRRRTRRSGTRAGSSRPRRRP
jgi:hypothetical protein